MGRVTYLHHYFPALYLAILNLAYIIDHFSRRFLGNRVRYLIVALFCLAVVGNFWYFKDFTFGMDGPAKNWAGRSWVGTWNLLD